MFEVLSWRGGVSGVCAGVSGTAWGVCGEEGGDGV